MDENKKKEMLSIRLGMLKLSGACVKTIKGNVSMKRCLIIPIDDNPCFYLGEKDCYLNLVAIDLRESMTSEQRSAMPILGNVKPIERQSAPQMHVGSMGSDVIEDADDLPF